MRTLKKRILKPFLFACLSLVVATITFASVERYYTVPSRPGRPSAFDIESKSCKLMFKKSVSNGGSPILFYSIEYKSKESLQWQLERTVVPQFSYNDVIQSNIDNRVGEQPVIFRVFAVNDAGAGDASANSDPITFRDPYKSK